MHDLLSIEKFLQFTADELLVDANEINKNTTFRSIRTWSSLNALVLISRINEEIDVLISASDLSSCQTLEDIHLLLKSRFNGID
jgi:acyl carrier protein